jgi:aldose 1-epimerase
MIGRREVDGFEALTIGSPDRDGIELAVVPAAGMVGCSLSHRGEEILGQRGGLRTYVAERSTMGIPLLHPWANRVAEGRFRTAGREVDLSAHPALVSVDPNGLPIHGLLAAAGGWQVQRHEETPDGSLLAAGFDFGVDEDLISIFPFPHRLRIEAEIADRTLAITTTVAASGDVTMPISFGFHPYFRLPGVERGAWIVEMPVSERIPVDSRGIPTGELERADVPRGPLGKRTFDDGFIAPAEPFALEGGGRRIEVSYDRGYPYAQVYAPDDDDVIAFEPMTAPTNALVSGRDLLLLEPGGSYEATFSITVSG